MNPEFESLCSRFLGALLNGSYQGLLLTCLVGLGLKAAPRTNAATRHAIALATLLLVAALPAAHFLLDAERTETRRSSHSRSTDETIRTSGEIPNSGTVQTSESMVTDREPPAPAARAEDRLNQKPSLMDSGLSSPDAESRGALAGDAVETVHRIIRSEALEPFPATQLPIPWSWRFSVPARMDIIPMGFWMVLAAARLCRLARQYRVLRHWKCAATSPPESVELLCRRLREEMNLKRTPRLGICPETATPIVVGFRRPAILLPSNLLAGAGEIQIEQVLRHELAHVGRWDDWANLLQQLVSAALFFHPAVWWLARRLTIDREIACDDHVLSATRARRAYALFLAEFASQSWRGGTAGVPAGWSNKTQLKERIHMILDSKRNASPRLVRSRTVVITVAAVLLAMFGWEAGPRLVFAQAAAGASAQETPAASASEETKSDPAAEPAPAAVSTTPAAAATSGSAASEKPENLDPTIETGPRPKPSLALPGSASAGRPGGPAHPPRVLLAPMAPGMTAPGAYGWARSAPAPLGYFAQANPRNPSPPDDDVAFPGKPVPPAAMIRPRIVNENSSIERRLERLERMVESLVARDKQAKKRKDSDYNFRYELRTPEGPILEPKRAESWSYDSPLDNEAIAHIKEQAKKAAELAAREGERAAREAGRAAIEAQRFALSGPKALELRRQILEAQRSALEQQIQALDRQIQQLGRIQPKTPAPESGEKRHSERSPEPERDYKEAPKANAPRQ